MAKSTVEHPEGDDVDLTKKALIRVLHVDDEAGFLKSAKQCIEMQGAFEVETASSVEEAQEKMKEKKFDVIISDYVMPRKDGLEFLKELRDNGNNIPFIMFTGRGREEVAIEALNLGADRYINKIGKPETVYYELAHDIRQTIKRKKAEHALMRSEEKYRSLIENIPDVAWTCSRGYDIVFITPNVEKVNGFTADEIIQMGSRFYDERIHPDDVEHMNKEWDLLFTEDKAFDVEYRLQRKDGQWIWVRDRAVKTYEKDGVMYADGLCSDITERKKAEERVGESEAKYRSLFENAGDAIVVFDLEGNVTSANNAVFEEYGFKRDEFVGKNMLKFVPRKYSLRLLKEIARLAGGEAVKGEIEIFTPKGKVMAEYRGNPIRRGKKVVGAQTIIRDITGRKKAQEALQASEEKYRSLVMNIPDVVWTCDREGNSVFISSNIETVCGHTPEEYYKRGNRFWFERIHPDDVKNVKEAYRALVEKETRFDVEYRIKRRDGKWIWVHDRAVTTYEKDGMLYAEGVTSDITERKKTEEALRYSEERYRNMFELAPDGVMTVDLKGVITSVNPTFLKLTGYSKEEIVGKHFTKLRTIRVRDIPRYLKMMRSALKGKTPPKFEYSYVRKNGTIGWAEGHFAFLRRNGKITGFQGILRELTEQKKAQKALDESEERYRALIEETPVGIGNIDVKGNLIYINKEFEKITGYSREEALGKNWFILARKHGVLSAEHLKLAAERIRARLMGKPEISIRLRLKRRDESVRWVESTAALIKKHGVPVGFQAAMRDITELVKSEKSLKEAVRKLGALNEKLHVVGGLTRHNTLNKLQATKNSLFLVRQKLGDNHEALEYLGKTESICEQVESFFNFARTYEKLGVEELVYMDLGETVDMAVSQFSNLADVKVVNVCRGKTVLADSLLREMFFNLIDNSLKHGEKVSQIRIYCEKGKDKLKLIYEDDGFGIPRAEKEKIFKEGYGKDTGYGLWLIRKMCEVYGWDIRETGKQGKGAQFTISIPTKTHEKAKKESGQLSQSNCRSNKKTEVKTSGKE